MLEQTIQRAIEAWTERGRERNAIKDGRTFVLRYGRRFKFMQVANLAVFVFFLGLGIVLSAQGNATLVPLLAMLLFGTLTVATTIYVIYVFTTRVIVDDQRVTVRGFGLRLSECTVESFASAYKSRHHDSIVLLSQNKRKTRVSTQLDGLAALIAWLWLRPRQKLDASIVLWMSAEAPDLGQDIDVD